MEDLDKNRLIWICFWLTLIDTQRDSETIVRCDKRLRSKYAYGKQERSQLCRIGFRKSLKKLDDGYHNQRRSANKRRDNSAYQRIGFIRDSNDSRRYIDSSFIGKKLYEDHDYNYYWFSGQKTQLITNDRKKEYDTTNHVQVVVPRLSTSSSSSSSPTSPSSSSKDVVTPTQHPASIRRESMSDEVRGDSSRDSTKIENPNTNDNEEVRDDTLRDLCEWLEEFKKNLVNSIQELRYASSSSHDLLSESLEKWYRNLHLLPEGSKLR